MKKSILLMVITLLAHFSYAQSVGIIYVDVDATGNNNGSTWGNAFNDLHDAIAAAGMVAEIWVAEGTYKPAYASRDSAFIPKPGIPIYGGFDGTESMREERDWRNNQTIISGDLQGNDNGNIFMNDASRSDNSYTLFDLTAAPGITIDGFYIQDGNCNGSSGNIQLRGAAFYVLSVTANHELTIQNCVIRNNSGWNGAVLSASPTFNAFQKITANIKNCEIYNNYGVDNTLLWAETAFRGDVEVNYENNLIYRNEVESSGGSMFYVVTGNGHNTAHSDLNLTFNTIVNNTFTNANPVNAVIENHKVAATGVSADFRAYFNIIYNPDIPKGFINTSNAANTQTIFANALSGDTIIPGDMANAYNLYPEFVDSANDNYDLTGCSFFKDATDEAFAIMLMSGSGLGIPSTDFYGNSRPQNDSIDWGATEFVFATGNDTFNICQGDSVEVNGQWIMASASGDYVLADINGCDSAKINYMVEMQTAPSPGITEAGGVLSAGVFDTYQWYLDGSAIAGATSSTYTPTADGMYTVEVSQSNGGISCNATSSAYNYTAVVSSINNQLENELIKVYPTINNGSFIIETSVEISVVLIDIKGCIVHKQNISNGKTEINVERAEAGVYFLHLTTSGQKLNTSRIIIR